MLLSAGSRALCAGLLCVVLLKESPGTCAQRTTVSLDLGWRTRPAPPPACAYTVAIPGIIQSGGWLAANVSSAAGCAAAACRANAQAWSFCGGCADEAQVGLPVPADGGCGGPALDPWHGWSRKCVLGNSGQLLSRNSPSFSNWTSQARRTAGPPADTVEARPGYDDGAWKVVDLPHDVGVPFGAIFDRTSWHPAPHIAPVRAAGWGHLGGPHSPFPPSL